MYKFKQHFDRQDSSTAHYYVNELQKTAGIEHNALRAGKDFRLKAFRLPAFSQSFADGKTLFSRYIKNEQFVEVKPGILVSNLLEDSGKS